jgi:hypothetical protein
VTAATPLVAPVPARTVRAVTAAVVEERPVSEVEEEPRELPPLVLTGDDETDEALAMLRTTTQQIHEEAARELHVVDEQPDDAGDRQIPHPDEEDA